MLLSKPSESVHQPAPPANWCNRLSQLPSSHKVHVNGNYPPPSPPPHPTQYWHRWRSSDLCEKCSTERRKGCPLTPKTLILLWACVSQTLPSFPWNTLSSQDTSSLFLIPPLLPSPAWLSEPILSLSHLSINLRKVTCTVYRINIWFLWFSVTLHLMVCYLPTYLSTYIPLKIQPLLHRAINWQSSLQSLGKDGCWGFPSLPLWHQGGKKGWCRQMELSRHCLLLSIVIIPLVDFCFPAVELLLDKNL